MKGRGREREEMGREGGNGEVTLTLMRSWNRAADWLRPALTQVDVTVINGSGPPFRSVRHSESCHSWSLQGIDLDIATTRRLTLTLTVSLTVSWHCWKWLKNGDSSEWRPLGMAGRHLINESTKTSKRARAGCKYRRFSNSHPSSTIGKQYKNRLSHV